MPHLIPRTPDPLDLIMHILDEPEAVAMVQALDSQAFGKLIQRIGLEDAGGIIALATAEQIEQLFDDDLWRNAKPGQEEVFNDKRFRVWLEVLVSADVEAAAAKLVEWDENFVLMLLDRFLMVLEHADLMAELGDNGEAVLTDKVLANHLILHFNSYYLVSKDDGAWESIIELLLEADKKYHEWLERLLRRCHRLSTSYVEDSGGLYQALSGSDQLKTDVMDEREQRREQHGHVAPQTAASFLQQASLATLDELANSSGDPITRAYFSSFTPNAPVGKQEPIHQPLHKAELDLKLSQILHEAKIIPKQLPGAKPELDLKGSLNPLRQALARLAETEPALHQQRLLELGFLANILMAGHSYKHRRYVPSKAAQTVIDICIQGMEYFAKIKGMHATAEEWQALVHDQDLVKMFKVGWNLLHKQNPKDANPSK